jgi:hypothetical protein
MSVGDNNFKFILSKIAIKMLKADVLYYLKLYMLCKKEEGKKD